MPRDDYWRLGGVVLDGHNGPEINHTYLEGYTLEVWLTSRSDSPAGAWPDYVERFKQLRRFRNFAGAYAPHHLSSGRVAFTETFVADEFDRPPNDSIFVGLQPPTDSRIGQGGWFLVEACESSTTLPSSLCQLSFELTFVAPLARYPDRDAALAALATEGI